jgi:ABC-type nitrate/sulfonate/bicarbonate transport system substrate-binding protein
MLQIGNSSARFAALAGGNIEWMVADPADVIPAQRQGYNVLLDLTTRGIDYQVSAIVMTEDFIRNRRDAALQFMRALIEGIRHFKTQKEEAIRSLLITLRPVILMRLVIPGRYTQNVWFPRGHTHPAKGCSW